MEQNTEGWWSRILENGGAEYLVMVEKKKMSDGGAEYWRIVEQNTGGWCREIQGDELESHTWAWLSGIHGHGLE